MVLYVPAIMPNMNPPMLKTNITATDNSNGTVRGLILWVKILHENSSIGYITYPMHYCTLTLHTLLSGTIAVAIVADVAVVAVVVVVVSISLHNVFCLHLPYRWCI